MLTMLKKPRSLQVKVNVEGEESEVGAGTQNTVPASSYDLPHQPTSDVPDLKAGPHRWTSTVWPLPSASLNPHANICIQLGLKKVQVFK